MWGHTIAAAGPTALHVSQPVAAMFTDIYTDDLMIPPGITRANSRWKWNTRPGLHGSSLPRNPST